jgi:hypothetical protein
MSDFLDERAEFWGGFIRYCIFDQIPDESVVEWGIHQKSGRKGPDFGRRSRK